MESEKRKLKKPTQGCYNNLTKRTGNWCLISQLSCKRIHAQCISKHPAGGNRRKTHSSLWRHLSVVKGALGFGYSLCLIWTCVTIGKILTCVSATVSGKLQRAKQGVCAARLYLHDFFSAYMKVLTVRCGVAGVWDGAKKDFKVFMRFVQEINKHDILLRFLCLSFFLFFFFFAVQKITKTD